MKEKEVKTYKIEQKEKKEITKIWLTGLSIFLENEERKDESTNYQEYFIKYIIKIKDIITNISNAHFKQIFVRISELKNSSSIDSPLLSKNYREL